LKWIPYLSKISTPNGITMKSTNPIKLKIAEIKSKCLIKTSIKEASANWSRCKMTLSRGNSFWILQRIRQHRMGWRRSRAIIQPRISGRRANRKNRSMDYIWD
jgi:hypothetical protein